MANLEFVLENINTKLKSTYEQFDKIPIIYQNKMSKNNLKLLSDISSNINLLQNQVNELYFMMLDENIDNNTISSADKTNIKNIKINNLILEKITPLIFYMKLVLENE